MQNQTTVLSADLPAEKLDLFFELIDPDWNVTSYRDAETGSCRVQVFLDDAQNREDVRDALVETAKILGTDLSVEEFQIAREDWSEAWKRFFHVERISEHLTVRPSWESYAPAEGERVIVVEPGMSFGTGKHPTTQGCLIYLDELAQQGTESRTVRDMGCGTGILAIGAKLLGFADVRAFDNDPDCIQSTQENAERNGLSIPVEIGDISHPWEKTDIVVANILAPVLVEFANQVAHSVRPQGYLILSGILDSQYADVRTAYEAYGAVEQSTRLIGEWRTGLFQVQG